MAETVNIGLTNSVWTQVVSQNCAYTLRVNGKDQAFLAVGGLEAPVIDFEATFLINRADDPQHGIHYGLTGDNEYVWARAERHSANVHVAYLNPAASGAKSQVQDGLNRVVITPTATGGGTQVPDVDGGVLYGAESPLGGPVVELRDASGLVAILTPGVPMDYTARPRQFEGPLMALALSAVGITSILLDLESAQ